MNYTHASIIPLIGGVALAQHEDSGQAPEYMMTYEGFQANESHILNHYRNAYNVEMPYYYLDALEHPKLKSVDVVNSVCPCAGLSQLSAGFGDHNQNNQWMIKTATYVLGTLKPRVFWGENAPGFAGKIGQNVRNTLYKIGRDNGYTMSVYRTRSLLHGTPQVRERSFYFFWKETDKTPLLGYFNRPWTKIEDLIRNVKANSQMEPINHRIPSESDPYYRFILEEVFGGISHREFSNEKLGFLRVRSNDVFSFIESQGYSYNRVADWLKSKGYEREYEKCMYKYDKLQSGKNIMRRGTIIPKDYIGAFVGHYPTCLTHPDEDRYITYREAMSIMGMPENFELLNPKKSYNHICQSVPVKTALDMCSEISKYLNGELEMINSTYTYQYNHSQTHEIESDEPTLTLENFFN